MRSRRELPRARSVLWREDLAAEPEFGQIGAPDVAVDVEDVVDDPDGRRSRPEHWQSGVEALGGRDVALGLGGGGGEHDVAGAGDRRREGPVVGRAPAGRLGEHDVEADRDRPPAEYVEQSAVQRPRPGPGQVEVGERVLVDRDDHDRGGRRSGPAEDEQGVEGVQVGYLQEPGQRDADDQASDRRGPQDGLPHRAPPRLSVLESL